MSNTITGNQLAYQDIYEQYVDEASFLWLMHTIAVDQPHYQISDLASLEVRIEAQLSGLMTNIELSWPICEKALELESGGEVFTAAVIAFRSHDQLKIQRVVEASTVSEDCLAGLIYALAWLPGNLVHDWIRRFFTSKDIKHKYLAMAACLYRRENPAHYLDTILTRKDCLKDIELYCTSLRAVGVFKRFDQVARIKQAIKHDDESVRFWALWSGILLGDKSLVFKLEPFVFAAGDLQQKAIQMAFRVLPLEDSRKWVSMLAADPQHIRDIVIITGVIGDPQSVDWLLQRMQEEQYARVAAEAFSMITGVDLVQQKMTVDAPEHIEPIPNDDADDENVKMHDDENLPWPNTTMIASYWNSVKSSYSPGHRYLLGKPIALASLKNDLSSAYQRQRHAIAMEISLCDKDEMLFITDGKVS